MPPIRTRPKVPYAIANNAKVKKAADNQNFLVAVHEELNKLTGRIETIAKEHNRSIQTVEEHFHLAFREKGRQIDIEELAQTLNAEYKSDACSEEHKELVQTVMASMEERRIAPKVTTREVQSDAQFTLKNIGKELEHMHCRDGVEYIAVACRGKPNDLIQPEFFASPGGETFLSGLLNTDGTQLAQQLEAFTALGKPTPRQLFLIYLADLEGRVKSDKARENLKAKARKLINGSLQEVTKVRGHTAEYLDYERLCSAYHVALEGWPAVVPYDNPSYLTVEQLECVTEAFESGKAKWVKVSRQHKDLIQRPGLPGPLPQRSKKAHRAAKQAENEPEPPLVPEHDASGSTAQPTTHAKAAPPFIPQQNAFSFTWSAGGDGALSTQPIVSDFSNNGLSLPQPHNFPNLNLQHYPINHP
ncbi:hypothetical protein BOTBODRAFT_49787 [Botryobasidium botryosum FD-172 SS1]|uniref:Uncharacterized protein n=1 Tax=Botryobasidium botryosum (strain FD-172 SS1) TaxID=930990 RepID=A0A067LQU4_BOTB1|nr:hypothetical protein BOTBODRAFT_49787 [Botryobasidium botryosum FD-172 SS1]